MSDVPPRQPEDSFLARLGIIDRASGIERAQAARERLIQAGGHVLGADGLTYTVEVVVFSGFLARAQGLHEGAVAAIEADNPYAAFTLLRAYAENAAAILYLKDHPKTLDRFWGRNNLRPVTIGSITSYASPRFGAFKPIYSQLSEYAHPASLSLLASHRLVDETAREVEWRSSPAFKSDGDLLVACGWVVELAEATSHLLVDYAATWVPADPAAEPERHPGP
jgi:hypothetical protein